MKANKLKAKMLAALDEHLEAEGSNRKAFILYPFKNKDLCKVRAFVESFHFKGEESFK